MHPCWTILKGVVQSERKSNWLHRNEETKSSPSKNKTPSFGCLLLIHCLLADQLSSCRFPFRVRTFLSGYPRRKLRHRRTCKRRRIWNNPPVSWYYVLAGCKNFCEVETYAMANEAGTPKSGMLRKDLSVEANVSSTASKYRTAMNQSNATHSGQMRR
jgi:hypothetical protein